jgi:iron complex outermembrane receptor protein
MKRILFFSLALLVWAGARAQISLNCQLIDANSGQPVTEAVAYQLDLDLIGEPDHQGKFTFMVNKPGTYTIEVVADNYERQAIDVVVESGQQKRDIQIVLVPLPTMLQAVEVSALRADEQTPIAKTDINREELQERNSGRDVPFLLEQTPSVVATSDAGAGVGYTNIRVRGSDITRINVTVNGIPINDAESFGVFWVNMPDLSSSTNSIQLQRGVGTSTNGASAFGATLNMETDGFGAKPQGAIQVGGGSFNTQRYTAQFGTGLINKHWWLSGRLSSITSDGYIDRATSDLKSYYISGGYANERTNVRAVVFGGRERTYQAWYGVDSATLATDRTFNFAGAIYDENWNVLDFYDNQVDNYAQDHYQLHVNHKLADKLKLNVSLHYTYGRGYFEEYAQFQALSNYGYQPFISGTDTISTTDLTRRKWLDNDFYGGIFNFAYTSDRYTSVFGGGIHQYDGRHFGQVIWAQNVIDGAPEKEYYRSNSYKTDVNVYWKNLYAINNSFTAFLDLQVRSVNYRASGTDQDFADQVFNFEFEQNNVFFNPKAGITYTFLNGNRAFASYAVGHREPNRIDLINADPEDLPKPERLQDFEFGFAGSKGQFAWEANAFYMFYNNQLVLTGELDPVGFPIRKNIGESYRIGIEFAATWRPLNWLKWSPTITYMQSQNLDFVQENADGTVNALGNTAIAFSPNTIAASNLSFMPVDGLTLTLFTKYVGEQFLDNSETSRLTLDDYLLNDIRISYDWDPSWIQNIRLYVHVLNAFNEEYSSNGYVFFGDPYFYPQAGTNLLAGLQVDF